MFPPIRGKDTAPSVLRLVLLLAVAAALLLVADSCRLSPLAPLRDPDRSTGTGVGGVTPASGLEVSPSPCRPGFVSAASYEGSIGSATSDELARVPEIARMRSEVSHGTLYLSGQLRYRDRWTGTVEYTPYVPGGWCLQVFLNTDRQRTGYWLGFDYIVRGVEWNPVSGASIVRRITLEPGYPGGWGPASGKATLRATRRGFAIAIPLGAIGGGGDDLDFALETYATVACPECESGHSQIYAADYFGSWSATRRGELAIVPRSTSREASRWSLRADDAHSAPASREEAAPTATR